MSQITIRNLPEIMENEIRSLAARKRISLSKAVVELLHKALGTAPGHGIRRDASCVSGIWGIAEHQEFANNTSRFDQIDGEIWQ